LGLMDEYQLIFRTSRPVLSIGNSAHGRIRDAHGWFFRQWEHVFPQQAVAPCPSP
jgi:hypothetical protein